MFHPTMLDDVLLVWTGLKTRDNFFEKLDLAYRGAILWNNLPASIKSADGTNNFNALIKKYDFESLKFDKFASLISFKDSLYEYF